MFHILCVFFYFQIVFGMYPSLITMDVSNWKDENKIPSAFETIFSANFIMHLM